MVYEYKDLKLDVEQIIKRSNRHTYFRFTSKDKMVITTPRELSVSSVYEIIEKHYDRIIKRKFIIHYYLYYYFFTFKQILILQRQSSNSFS